MTRYLDRIKQFRKRKKAHVPVGKYKKCLVNHAHWYTIMHIGTRLYLTIV